MNLLPHGPFCARLVSLWVLVAFAAPVLADDTLATARKALEDGRFTRAEQLLRPLVAADPDGAEAHALLGRALLGQGRHAAALPELERAVALDAAFPGLQRDLGAALLRAGEYARARDALERAVGASPADGRAWIQLGLAELELGRTSVAEEHFERARRVDPELEQIALYNIGVARSRSGDAAGAGRALRDAVEVDSTSGVARRAERLLGARPSEPEQPPVAGKPWKLAASLGVLWDDNVTTAAIDQTSEESDGAATGDLSAAYGWRTDDGRWRADASYDFLQTSYFHESESDLQIHSAGLNGVRGGGWVDLAAGYRYSYSTLGGDRLLDIHELRPAFQFAPGPRWFAIAGPRMQWKDFDDDDDARDARQLGLAGDLFFFFHEYRAWTLLSLQLESEDADDRSFDYDGLQVRAGLHLPFPWLGVQRAGLHPPFPWLGVQNVLDLSYRFHLRDYDAVTPSIGERRDDRLQSARLRLTRNLSARLSVRLEYEYTDSDSNLSDADYTQNTLGLSLGVSF